MNNDEEVMSAEEFFGELAYEKKAPVRKGRGRGKKSANDLFAEIKVKMVDDNDDDVKFLPESEFFSVRL